MSAPDPLETVLDADTLVERVVDQAAGRARVELVRAELREPADEIDELRARGDLVDLLRQLGDLDAALREGRAAVDRAEIVGRAAQQHLARVRLAEVQVRRGDYAEASLIVTELLAVADQFGPVVESFTYQLAGLDAYAQGHWADAAASFERALRLRERLELPEAEASRTALHAARRREAEER